MSLQDLRKQYMQGGLNESDLLGDPIDQFRHWIDEALANNVADWFEPNAMTLATSTADGGVTARIVLLKHFDADGFVFFTNYESAKGRQLKENARVALVMYWPHLERQVRIEGQVDVVSRELSEKYFHSRPRGSQIGAVVSQQSLELSSRADLSDAAAALEASLDGAPVPLPDFWGGYRVAPECIEFWQGRESRLHDRILFERLGNSWSHKRLAP